MLSKHWLYSLPRRLVSVTASLPHVLAARLLHSFSLALASVLLSAGHSLTPLTLCLSEATSAAASVGRSGWLYLSFILFLSRFIVSASSLDWFCH